MSSFLPLLDDIAALLDDTATMTKVAAKKTVSVLGDDLAVNAEKSSDFKPSRELIVIKDIAIGAFKNKLILLPLIFFASYIYPPLIIGFLFMGAAYLSLEGIEAVKEYFTSHKNKDNSSEKEKISKAIKTDFILSIEIIVIAYSTVMDQPFINQVITVTIIAFAAVVFVYGLVALIVRIDDFGFWLSKKGYPNIGLFFIKSLAWIIKSLKLIGMLAMFLVAGGILSHNIHYLHEIKVTFSTFPGLLFDLGIGFVLGLIVFSIIELFHKIKG